MLNKKIYFSIIFLFTFISLAYSQEKVKWKTVNIELVSISNQSYFFLHHLNQVKSIVINPLQKQNFMDFSFDIQINIPFKNGEICHDCDFKNTYKNVSNEIFFEDLSAQKDFNYLFSKMKINIGGLEIDDSGKISGIIGEFIFRKNILENLREFDSNKDRELKISKMFPINDSSCNVYLQDYLGFTIIPFNIHMEYSKDISKKKYKAFFILNHFGGYPQNEIDNSFKKK